MKLLDLNLVLRFLTGQLVQLFAVANTKSNIVTNADAEPYAASAALISHGRLREQVATVAVAAADDDNSVYRLFRVPSNIRVSELLVLNDAITGGTSYDLGVYDIDGVNQAAVVDADLFASAVTMASARTAPLDVTHESGQWPIEEAEQALWEALGLASDPDKMYDIALTANTVGSAAGDITVKIRYSDGS